MSGSNPRSLQRQRGIQGDSAKMDGAKILMSKVQVQLTEMDALNKQLTHMAANLKAERDGVKGQLDEVYSSLINIAYIKGWLDPESIEVKFDPNALLARYALELIGDDEAVAAAEEVLKQKFVERKERAKLRIIEIEAERGCNYQLKLNEGKNLAPDGKAHSPIHEHDDGSWWLYDRRWREEFGPFEDERSCTEGCERYIKFCETGQKQLLTHSAFDAFKEKMRVEFEAAREVARKLKEQAELNATNDSTTEEKTNHHLASEIIEAVRKKWGIWVDLKGKDFVVTSFKDPRTKEDAEILLQQILDVFDEQKFVEREHAYVPAPVSEVAPKRFKKVYGLEEEGEGK